MDPATEVDPPVMLREVEILAGGLAAGVAIENTGADYPDPNTNHTYTDLSLISLESSNIMNTNSVIGKVTTLTTV
jgi:hypothetical protein